MTSVYEREICSYFHVYKAPTIAASQDFILKKFAYLKKVDKISINSDRHVYCGDSVVQSKVVYIDSPISPKSKINDSSMNYSSSQSNIFSWLYVKKPLLSYS